MIPSWQDELSNRVGEVRSNISNPEGDNPIENILNYVRKNKDMIKKEKAALKKIGGLSPDKKITDSINMDAVNNIWDRVKTGPLVQLGKDFVSEQVAVNGARVINNAEDIILDKFAPVIDTAQKAHSIAFDAVAAAMVAKNDLIMGLIQKLAQTCVESIRRKREILIELQTKLRELYNALILLVAGDPFFSKYLKDLRSALRLIVEAENDLVLVRNTYFSQDIWLSKRFNDVDVKLKEAEALMEPDPLVEPDNKITGGVLDGVGVPSKPQQLTILITIPKLCKEAAAAAHGYFLATLKTNALLLAFTLAYSDLHTAKTDLMKDFTLNTLDNIFKKLDSLVDSMATTLNGDPNALLEPMDGFEPDSIKTSASSLGWLFQLKTIIYYLKVIPGDSLESIQASNVALDKYNESVEQLKTKNDRKSGQAILNATHGREDIGDLEIQVVSFTMYSLQAMVDAKASSEILSLGRTLISRLDLSIEQDREIEAILTGFIKADLGLDDTLGRLTDNVTGVLDKFGFDRASDLLNNGSFKEFFNTNSKTATYAGAALLAISAVKNCLKTEEDREQLNKAGREIQKEQKTREILYKRTASTGYANATRDLEKKERRFDTLEQRTEESARKIKVLGSCEIGSDFIPSNPLKAIGSVAAIGVTKNGLPKNLQDLGRGVL